MSTQPSATQAGDTRAPSLFAHQPIAEVVVPVADDGSHERGVFLGSQVARLWDVPIRLVHVCRPDAAAHIAAEDTVNDIVEAQRSAHPALRITSEIVENTHVGRGVFSVVNEQSLVCVATDLVDEQFDPRSVGEQVAGEADCGVLLFGPHCQNINVDGSIVVALDGSDRAEHGIAPAIAWAAAAGTNVWLVNVVGPNLVAFIDERKASGEPVSESSYLRSVAERFANAPVPVHWEVVHGADPIERLSGFARVRESGLVLTSPHHTTEFTRGIFDSTSMGLAAESSSPVLVIKTDPHVEADQLVI